MTDLTKLTLAQARDGLKKKTFTATELTQAHLKAIEAGNAALNAYVLVTADHALAQAAESDKRIASGKARDLEGLPLGNKDLFCTKDIRTTACSKILGDFKPAYESTVGANLWNAGAVMLGKLNNDEFAMGSSNETSAFGPVVNPWRRIGANGKALPDKLVPGGSSGGSSAAVAGGLCLAATATDTGGSIRQPAALTGTVGIKANLRPLFTLGHRSLRLIARSGGPDRQDRPRHRDHAQVHGWPRPQGHHQRRRAGARLRSDAEQRR